MTIQRSWAWISDRSLKPGDEGNLTGYQLDPNASYKRVAFRDGDENGSVDDIDTPGAHTNDGVTIDGFTYNIKDHWTFIASIQYKDGSQIDTKIMVMRLWDDPDISGRGPYHGKLLFRIHDDIIDKIFEGIDGPGGEIYPMRKILKIIIGEFVKSVNGRSLDGLAKEIPVCFSRGTSIETSLGSVYIEHLKVGDLIRTQIGEFRPVLWIGSWKISAFELMQSPYLLPVLIQAGSLGEDKPKRDLLVSQQHRILIRSRIAKRMFGVDEVLVAAKHLTAVDGIEYMAIEGGIEYFHIIFKEHEVIFANGAEAESLYLGPQAIRSFSLVTRKKIFLRLSQLSRRSKDVKHTPAKQFVSGRMGRRLAERHRKNDCQLVSLS